MSLQLRQMMERQLDYQKSMPSRSIQSIENQLLDVMAMDNPYVQLGSLCVITAELVEHVRRSDPAYGLESYHDMIARAYGEST